MPDYTSKDKKTLKDRVFEHLDRILEISTKEFVAGYWEKKIKDNQLLEIYHPDSRRCFIQAVETWADVLAPYFKVAEGMEDKIKTIEKELKETLEKYEEGKLDEDKYIILKLRLIRKLFRLLNIFLEQSNIGRLKTKTTAG